MGLQNYFSQVQKFYEAICYIFNENENTQTEIVSYLHNRVFNKLSIKN